MASRPARRAAIFSQPRRQIFAMVMVLVLVSVGIYVALPSVLPVFMANPLLNGFIAMVFLIGVLTCFWQQVQLIQSVNWIEGFARDDPDHRFSAAPRLLAPLAALLRSRGRQRQISAPSSRSILDSVATRIDEARDITRYIVNVLIFLGLLGTFYGLATTVPAIVETIRSLSPGDGTDGMQIFGQLIDGLEAQLGGMGVAFGSSLLGLAGSLVVGLLELFASHSQNRFYRELEEWLSSITRLGFAGSDGDGMGAGGPGEMVMESLVEQLDRLEGIMHRTETAREDGDRTMGRLADAMTLLAENANRGSELGPIMTRVAEGQDKLAGIYAEANDAGGLDSESRMRLRSIDVQLMRLHEELTAGRQETNQEVRQEIRALARSLQRPRATDTAARR